MSYGRGGPTRALIGPDALTAWLPDGAGRTAALLVDSAVATAGITALVRNRLGRARWRTTQTPLTTGPGDLGTAAAIAEGLADKLAGIGLVVAIGGGSVLDQAKIAALLRANPVAYTRLTVPQRGGLMGLPGEVIRTVPLLAVPTTLGTGSEVSAVACLAYPQGKRLILGGVLRPEAALLDPSATATLPRELVVEGVLEALFRAVSPYAGDHRDDRRTEDRLTETVARRLVQLGYEAVREARPSDALRLDIAKLSGLTHGEWLHQGRDPYAVKGWLIANEMSSALGVRKMTAVAALLPHLWRAVLDGEPRLGSAPRLHRMWAGLRDAAPQERARALPEDPADGIEALMDDWRVGRRLTADGPGQIEALAERTVRAWGAGLPMLGGLRAEDVRRLLDAALGATTAHTARTATTARTAHTVRTAHPAHT
ncbi:iron-containing alcohol dehydrogenase [Streptomyces europaeiscabiei]|uniref:Iron-containing alcohol dehydrogenase n=1 Tax=Streptomyces europaeiscabiei TaxID=146819 RepID=A0ABU4NIX6_9ACTN|nr:daptide-type RiPP biosynthesis dehydogenase [Streptomyces europaeiscabiei]MDX3544799.1 iron-containing alcohol dehydrogenase [Streptomyces europaeiscabiei]MDX3554487.1 iron-containing alcohol dehydrogenase [Streptomyces europaeiscabiei]MDX3670588.1 iron-containing alcohol dehydrogenase [Streptomyces europaeiscabiei]MDX3702611.1 iron-containing alcohol dehydrogenase [Streptomyces europaeiscabiei]